MTINIIKNKFALPVVEILLQEMDFNTYFVVNYDPQHVISLITLMNKNKAFEHQVVEGLVEKVNWLDYPRPMENVEVTQENPLAMVKETWIVTPIARIPKVTGKRTLFRFHGNRRREFIYS